MYGYFGLFSLKSQKAYELILDFLKTSYYSTIINYYIIIVNSLSILLCSNFLVNIILKNSYTYYINILPGYLKFSSFFFSFFMLMK